LSVKISLSLTNVHRDTVVYVYTHFLNIRDIILVGNDNVMLLS